MCCGRSPSDIVPALQIRTGCIATHSHNSAACIDRAAAPAGLLSLSLSMVTASPTSAAMNVLLLLQGVGIATSFSMSDKRC
jgi:hypothetical protein